MSCRRKPQTAKHVIGCSLRNVTAHMHGQHSGSVWSDPWQYMCSERERRAVGPMRVVTRVRWMFGRPIAVILACEGQRRPHRQHMHEIEAGWLGSQTVDRSITNLSAAWSLSTACRVNSLLISRRRKSRFEVGYFIRVPIQKNSIFLKHRSTSTWQRKLPTEPQWPQSSQPRSS